MSHQVEQFQQRIEELVTRFEREVDRAEWATKRYPKRMRDDDRKIYESTALRLQRGPTWILLDPIGYDIPGAEGAADLYLMPGYDPTASLFYEGGEWLLYCHESPGSTEARPASETQALPLSAELINQVLDSIAEHAVL